MPRIEVESTQEPTNDFFEAIYSQRAIRYFKERPVPRGIIEQIIEGASKAPSGTNRQPWQFVVVEDADKRFAIGEALRQFFQTDEVAQQVQKKLDKAEESQDKSERLLDAGARNIFAKVEAAPVIIVPCLYQLESPVPDPSTLIAGSSIYLAVQNLLLTARALGIGTLMTTSQAWIEPVVREVLELPDEATPAALIPMGYPDKKFGATKRKPVEEIIRWNGWGNK